MTTIEYYNAKPSKVSNIGKDVSGAKRMNFDTYETVEERQAKEKKKVQDKNIAILKEEIKKIVLSDNPSTDMIINLKAEIFECEYGFSPRDSQARTIIAERRKSVIDKPTRQAFNKLITSFNRFNNEAYKLTYYPTRFLSNLRKKYAPKKTFTEQSGISYNWNQFRVTETNTTVSNYLKQNVNALQFGNSVTDNERAYICLEMEKFITQWRTDTRLNRINLMPINWSFGARGKAGSVAYYESMRKVISVNRNRIGSIIHEVGHYIDDLANNISNKISYETVNKYRESIKDGLDDKSLRYYCQRCEIFARAFEAYCFSINADFSEFAQVGKDYLPELNEELIGLIKQSLN